MDYVSLLFAVVGVVVTVSASTYKIGKWVEQINTRIDSLSKAVEENSVQLHNHMVHADRQIEQLNAIIKQLMAERKHSKRK